MTIKKKLSKFTLLRAAFNSFYIQASWNFERMQALGFVHCLSRAVRTLYDDPSMVKKSLLHHLEFFNTNPYLASTIVGVVLNLEEKHLENKNTDIDSGAIKARLMGPFGAIGDSLFWATFRPLAAIIGTFLAFNGIKAAPVYFLIIYNIPTQATRFVGLFKGYQFGLEVVDKIKKLNLNLYMSKMKGFSCFLLGLFLGTYILSSSFHLKNMWAPANVVLGIILVNAFMLALRKKVPLVALIYILTIICIGIGYMN